MNEKFISKKELKEKKKILLKLMEEGKIINLNMKKNPERLRKIKKLSNY